MKTTLHAIATCAAGVVPVLAQAAPSPAPSAAAAPAHVGSDPALLALLWTQHAAEHHALCRGTFNAARAMLDVALRDPEWTAALEQMARNDVASLPPAIVVDADETVIDNSAFQARCVLAGASFTGEAWAKWTHEAQAGPVPGAVEFTNYAARRRITTFYVTNRSHDQEEATRANLARLGFPLMDTGDVDVVLTRNEHDKESDKAGRRARVAATHRILLLVGDDLGDFLPGVRLRQGAKHTAESRRREGEALAAERLLRIDDFGAYWGTRWFMLPNPMYGSWLDVLKACAPDGGDRGTAGAAGTAPDLPALLTTREIAVEPAGAK